MGIKNIVTLNAKTNIVSLKDKTHEAEISIPDYNSDNDTQDIKLKLQNKNGTAFAGVVNVCFVNESGAKFLRHSTPVDGTKFKGVALVTTKGTVIVNNTTNDKPAELSAIPNASGELDIRIDNGTTPTADHDVSVIVKFADLSFVEVFKINPA